MASVTHNILLACRRQAQQDVEFEVPKQKRRVRGLSAMLHLCLAMCLPQIMALLASKSGLCASPPVSGLRQLLCSLFEISPTLAPQRPPRVQTKSAGSRLL